MSSDAETIDPGNISASEDESADGVGASASIDAHEVGAGEIFPVSQPAATQNLTRLSSLKPVRAHVDFAFVSRGGDVVLIGWLYDPQEQVRGFDVIRDPQNDAIAQQAPGVESAVDVGVRIGLTRVARPDVAQVMDKGASASSIEYGFVLVAPGMGTEAKVALMLADGRCAELPFKASDDMSEIRSTLPKYWSHSGPALLDTLRRTLGEQNALTRLAKGVDDQDTAVGPRHSFAACDQALLLANRVLIITGWISKTPAELERIEVVVADKTIDITKQIVRYVRPDLNSAHLGSEVRLLGFLCAFALDMDTTNAVTLNLVCHSGMRQLLECDVQDKGWDALGSLLRDNFDLAWALLGLLEKIPDDDDGSGRLAEWLAELRRDCFLAHVSHLPSVVDEPETAIAKVEWAYPLGSSGVLLYGWKLTPVRKPRAILLRGSKGESLDISALCTPVFRPQESGMYRSRFSELDDWCGFVCIAPVPTRHGDMRVLCPRLRRLGRSLDQGTHGLRSAGRAPSRAPVTQAPAAAPIPGGTG